MILVRNIFSAKPGNAGKLLAQMKEIVKAGDLRNPRFLTDLSGDFNTVVMEHEVGTLAELEDVLQKYMTDPQVRAKASGYTDFWISGRREIFRIA